MKHFVLKIKLTLENCPDKHSAEHKIVYVDIFYLSHLTFGYNNLLLNHDLVTDGQEFLKLFHVLPTENKQLTI